MQFVRAVSSVVVASLLVAGCGDSTTEATADTITVEDLVGSWSATSQTFTNNANASETFDWVGSGGTMSVTVLTGGRARTWLTLDTFYDEWDAQLSISGDVLTSTPAESSRAVERSSFTLNGNVLTLRNTSTLFDFTLAGGTPVPATVDIVLQRN